MKITYSKEFLLFILLINSLLPQSAFSHTQARADGHAPISIMGDHVHKQGEWMMSYRYMHMDMKNLKQGDRNINTEQALNDYMMVPKAMTMKMHMLGLMYAPTDDITLMLMTNYLQNDMESVMRMPMSNMNTMTAMPNAMHNNPMTMRTSMTSDGLGDSRFGMLIRGWEGNDYRTHFNIGVNLPTGDIDVMHTNTMGKQVVSGYPMQLGSGTYNLFGAFTYVYQHQDWQYGFQANYETALEKNDRHYKPGNKLLIHNWLSYSWAQSFSTSLRLSLTDNNNYSGADQRLNPMMMPTDDPQQRGSSIIDAALGGNYLFTNGPLSGQRIALELATPISQDYDGIQMKNNWRVSLGWQMAF